MIVSRCSVEMHGAMTQEPCVPRQCFIKKVGGVLAGCKRHSPFEVVEKRFAIIRMGAVLDDPSGTMLGRQSS